ncbi:hypothetical protein [Mucilaginibacter limnophilus]|nr:hypothetical protein [Mucilaginibacter limnophilus]
MLTYIIFYHQFKGSFSTLIIARHKAAISPIFSGNPAGTILQAYHGSK